MQGTCVKSRLYPSTEVRAALPMVASEKVWTTKGLAASPMTVPGVADPSIGAKVLPQTRSVLPGSWVEGIIT